MLPRARQTGVTGGCFNEAAGADPADAQEFARRVRADLLLQ